MLKLIINIIAFARFRSMHVVSSKFVENLYKLCSSIYALISQFELKILSFASVYK